MARCVQIAKENITLRSKIKKQTAKALWSTLEFIINVVAATKNRQSIVFQNILQNEIKWTRDNKFILCDAPSLTLKQPSLQNLTVLINYWISKEMSFRSTLYGLCWRNSRLTYGWFWWNHRGWWSIARKKT